SWWRRNAGRALVGVMIVACRASHASITGAYMHSGSTEIDYVSITQTGQKLSGYLQSVRMDLTAQGGRVPQHLRFVGEIDGSSFNLHAEALERFFGGGLGDCSGKW